MEKSKQICKSFKFWDSKTQRDVDEQINEYLEEHKCYTIEKIEVINNRCSVLVIFNTGF
jgi:hypothetical protein